MEVAKICHHHVCQKPQMPDSLYCEHHQYCAYPICNNRNERGSFYCKEHQNRSETPKVLTIPPPPVNPIIDNPPEQPLSGSVNIQLDYLKRVAEYWKERANYWRKQYFDSRK